MKKLFIVISRFFLVAIFFSPLSQSSFAQSLDYTVDSTGGLDAVSYDGGSTEMEFTDINNDGFLDIMSIGDHGSPGINTNQHGIMIWFGNGTGTNWNIFQNGSFGYGGIAVGDVNNDGNKDVGYAMHHNYSSTDFGNQYIEVSLGDGTGFNWTPWDDSLGLDSISWGMSGTDFGDINNDGYLDVGSNSFGCCDGVHIYKNNNNGTWTQVYGFIGNNSNNKIRFGDIDNDGNMDFVVGRQYGTCYFGDGTGNFVLNDSGLIDPGPVGFLDLSLADVDNDGTLELGCLVGGIGRIYKYSKGIQQWQYMSTGLPSVTHYAFTLKDLDIDGFVDLVSFQHERMTVYRGDGGTTWTIATTDTIKELERVWDTNIADVDHSGTPDILMLGRYPTGIVTDVVRLKLFKEATVATSLNIASVYPKGSECFPINSARFIEWISSVPQGMKGRVKLELSTTGLTGPWTLIDSGLPDNGRYQWIVPSSISSLDCHIRYTITDSLSLLTISSISPRSFNIGCVSTVPVNEIRKNSFDVSVYPNPFHDKTRIFIPAKNETVTGIKLYDLEGRIIYKINSLNENPITLQRNGLLPGIYILQISTKDYTDIYKKIIIN